MTGAPEIEAGEVNRLLALSRRARWTFPTSSGSPVRRAQEDEAVELLVAEQDALAEACRFLIESGDRDAALELAANTWRLWMMTRDLAGGRAFLAAVLDGGDATPSRERALALYGDGLLAFWQGAHDESRRRNEAALAAARAVDDPEALALARLGLSRSAFSAGDFAGARSLARQAREHAYGLEPAMGQAPLHLHAQGTRFAGDLDEAAALFEESLALNRRLDDEGMVGVELHNLGHVEIHRGNVDAAERLFTELEALTGGDDPYGRALARLNEGVVAFARDDRDRAATLLAEVDAVLAESGTELAPDDRYEVEALRDRLAAR